MFDFKEVEILLIIIDLFLFPLWNFIQLNIFLLILFIAEECVIDRCGHFPCRHGGKCLPSDQGAICLCPLGFGGDLCEMRLDLQVINTSCTLPNNQQLKMV